MSAIPEDLDGRLRDVERVSQSNTDKMSAHEDLCAERYKGIHDSIAAIRGDSRQTNAYLIGVGLALVAGLAKLVFFP